MTAASLARVSLQLGKSVQVLEYAFTNARSAAPTSNILSLEETFKTRPIANE